MSIKNRLLKLEQYRPVLIYPSFSDSFDLQNKIDYDNWLLKNNIGLTQGMIDGLNILHFDELYP